ncbi:glycosyltransferase family 2 protein [Rivibacter subsaxonicus]|uniref:Cellulose synthase/poly-beta-1,6-N-acetylglucosamine synthase-like glycosyltransferase n=1 Tax=Rivibacter subsaxonicus TaxID=457575 RepID=A0A4Q7VGR1_9BURK|nr:glycosyltransferase family 2 protein [Rivibacter subsaxonicus]RZT95231.1 cellulose synthase/poly-beta-1,6-N-acetylglucosamine synthase-like glycosyltransferase [Rivibacter subsaxonicus]
MSETLLLSVVAPCRNERAHIDAFCDAVLAQVLPPGWAMEVLIADGESDDGTRERLLERCGQDVRLALVPNPGRIVSTGLNACIARARGSVIARLDLHTRYAGDYLAQCLAALDRSGADNVGGPWVAEGEGPMGEAIAAAFQSRWVVGGARSRDVGFEGEVDSVYLGCWPRSSFERFGGFDDALVRNQDDEHNLRLRLAGGRIWQSARIRSSYRPRGSLRQLFAQQRQYGYWRPFVMRKHGQPGSLRQLVPALFVAALVLCVLLLPWTAKALASLLLAYGAYAAVASVLAARRGGSRLLPRLPLVIAAFHLGYGIGSWQGLWDLAWRGAPSPAFARLTR